MSGVLLRVLQGYLPGDLAVALALVFLTHSLTSKEDRVSGQSHRFKQISRTSKILFINLNTTRPYIFAITRSSSATSTIRYQYNLFPSTGFATPLAIKKSVNPLSSYEIALVVDLAERCSLAALSNLSACTSCRRYSSSS